MLKLRHLLGALLLGIAGQAFSQDGAPFLFAVNEGVTYRANPMATAERFRDVAEDLSKLLRRPVRIQSVTDYKELAAGLAEQRYDLAWVHPAHHSIRAMTRSGYKLVAVTKGFTEYRASFMVPGNSTFASLADLKGRKVGAPDEDSITSVLMRATLRDAMGPVLPETTYVRLQEAVPFMIENSFVAAGVTASRGVVKAWTDKGGKVLGASKPIPIKHLIASAKLPEAQRATVAAYFLGLDPGTTDGKRRLDALAVPGFQEYDQAVLMGMAKWLGV